MLVRAHLSKVWPHVFLSDDLTQIEASGMPAFEVSSGDPRLLGPRRITSSKLSFSRIEKFIWESKLFLKFCFGWLTHKSDEP